MEPTKPKNFNNDFLERRNVEKRLDAENSEDNYGFKVFDCGKIVTCCSISFSPMKAMEAMNVS